MKVVFAGNQNCGKTTLFNLLTNNNAKVGNFPGITVDIAKGKMGNIEIYDLPGIYSLNAVSSEEFIAANAINELKPDKIVNVIDATSLRRGLYLTMQLKELGVPMIAVLNMMDEEKRKGSIDIKLLSKKLGIPVVGISAKKKYNIPELISLLKTPPSRIEPFRISPTSLKERTEYIYGEIDKICNECINEHERIHLSIADRLLTGRFTSLPCFLLILVLILYLTFFVFGQKAGEYIEIATDKLSVFCAAFFENASVSPFVSSLVCDGIISSLGSVFAFLPSVLLLFFFLSLLEDSGYMARIAFIMDTPMSLCGLSGKSIVPMVMGLGCSVPALLACRTLEESRRTTALCVPFISCSARLPVYLFIASRFSNPFLILFLLYSTGFLCAFTFGFFLKGKERPPFLLELPPYRFPKLSNVFKNMTDKAADFIKRVFSVIFLASVAVWLLSNISFSLKYDPQNSIMLVFAKSLLPVFKPIGITSWQLIASLLAGISAKEAIISSLSLFSFSLSSLLPAQSLAFLFFCSLYTPCIATISLISREYGAKWAFLSVIMQTLCAYAIAFIVFTAASLIF